MNMRTDAPLAETLTALEDLGLKVAQIRAPTAAAREQADAWLRIGRGKNAVGYFVEVKRAVAVGTVGGVVAQLRDKAAQADWPALLVADYLAPQVAEKLRAQDQQFADAAGNAYLKGPGLYVYVRGQRPKDRPAAARPRAGNAAELKVLFALLCDPSLAQAPQRTLAAAANVALGAVPAALQGLRNEGHLLTMKERRSFRGTKRLLDEWAQHYAMRLRPKTLVATYVTEHFDTWKDWRLDKTQLRWGGEPAAALLTKYLRPGVLTLYADRLPPRFIVEQRLRKDGPLSQQRYVELRRPFWGDALNVHPQRDVVPPVLIYADLLATGDGRCIETAQMLYEDHLAQLLPTT